MLVADLIPVMRFPQPERMNSPLENREVRLRGLVLRGPPECRGGVRQELSTKAEITL